MWHQKRRKVENFEKKKFKKQVIEREKMKEN
jgi:hypothetical protein